ncbi:hypothetical protein BDZ94DRAFT_907789 [Collybia nuda]|uniref:Uncharacterized protein n=1 Tax=Collybia nuda TaxID=64659 RepID=A0A9P5YHA1_9AGAR|nr:hypothetical protein BDZ94DRAFT_907789 [Collybia nuda]
MSRVHKFCRYFEWPLVFIPMCLYLFRDKIALRRVVIDPAVLLIILLLNSTLLVTWKLGGTYALVRFGRQQAFHSIQFDMKFRPKLLPLFRELNPHVTSLSTSP